MKKFDLRSLMHNAWSIYRKGGYSFSVALRLAWSNAKLNALIKEHAQVGEESHSFAGWKALGYAVRHGEHAAYSVMIADPSTKTGYRKKSYFTSSQVQPIRA